MPIYLSIHTYLCLEEKGLQCNTNFIIIKYNIRFLILHQEVNIFFFRPYYAQFSDRVLGMLKISWRQIYTHS